MPCSLLKLASSFYLASIHNACSLQKTITHLWQLSPIFPQQIPVWYGFPWQAGPDHPPDSREFWDTDVDTGVVPLVCLGSHYHLKLLKTNRYYTIKIQHCKFFLIYTSTMYLSKYMLSIYLRIKVLSKKNDLKFWELIFVDCQLFESLYR